MSQVMNDIIEGKDKASQERRRQELIKTGKENRKVIAAHLSSDRRMSLADEISYAQSVIVKSDEEREKNRHNSLVRKTLRDVARGRKQSFAEEVALAKRVIKK